MDGKTRSGFLMWSRTPEFVGKVAASEEMIRHALAVSRPYLAYSGGKDSLSMLHLVCKQAPYILVYHHSQGKYMPKEIEREIVMNAIKAGAKNIRIYPSERDFWTDIVNEIKQRRYNAVFVGLRKEESAGRRSRIKERKRLTIFREWWPMQNWTWMDVWAYIVSNNLSYPSVYDNYAELDGWDKVRFHSFFDPSTDKFGRSNVDGVLLWKHKYQK